MPYGKLTNEFKEYLFDLALRNTGVPIETLYIGLSSSEITENTKLIDIDEITESNYERQKVNFTVPLSINNITKIFNTEEISFGPWEEDSNLKMKAAFITNQKNDANGMLMIFFPLTDTIIPFADDELTISKDKLEVNLE
ncbi:MAG: phage tail fiber protein [Bacillota bacterium]